MVVFEPGTEREETNAIVDIGASFTLAAPVTYDHDKGSLLIQEDEHDSLGGSNPYSLNPNPRLEAPDSLGGTKTALRNGSDSDSLFENGAMNSDIKPADSLKNRMTMERTARVEAEEEANELRRRLQALKSGDKKPIANTELEEERRRLAQLGSLTMRELESSGLEEPPMVVESDGGEGGGEFREKYRKIALGRVFDAFDVKGSGDMTCHINRMRVRSRSCGAELSKP